MTVVDGLEIGLVAALTAVVVTILLTRRSVNRERRYRQMLGQLPKTTVLCFDRDLRVTLALGESFRTLDIDPLGRHVGELIPEADDRDWYVDQYRAVLSGETRAFEFASSDSGRSYAIRLAPMRDGGSISGVIAVLDNITGRRELTAKAAERQVVLDLMNEAYVATDSDGIITGWNRASETTFGWSAEEALGRDVTELIVPAEDVEEFRGILTRSWPGIPATGRFEIRTERHALARDGRTFPVELAVTIAEVDGEDVVHALMHDITARKLAEGEMREHATDFAALASAVGELARSNVASEARAAICRAAAGIADADAAVLLEPDPSGTGLRTTASVGVDVVGEMVQFTQTAASVRLFGSREPFFSEDVAVDRSVRRSFFQDRDLVSVYWVPIVQDDDAVGVITIGWNRRVPTPTERIERLMSLIAAEAGVAIERAALLDRLERMAHTDDLTGLINRRAWDRELGREVSRARRNDGPLAVAMLDLDRFKAYNDRHGHQAGDRVLREAASAWKAVLRDSDLLARYGGEEFAVALPGCDLEQAGHLVNRLREVTPAGQSCSAGLAVWDGVESTDELLGRADDALYEAKQTGRDRTVVA
jgi:diguanylate cyclase (GGDEF)-like protein/PAS domain S-box-containing protein